MEPQQVVINFEKVLDDFISLHDGVEQRGQAWYASMAYTVGGSEVSALMGKSPYADKYDIMLRKIATIKGEERRSLGDACSWGTIFEDVVGSYVSIDIGSQLKGDSICIQKYKGHRNSPDGYIIAKFYHEDGELKLWTTDQDERDDTIDMILLLEFKCPLLRKPRAGFVPDVYIPQVWSGLMVTPVANQGLFVDSVFRKCSIGDFEYIQYENKRVCRQMDPTYDTTYHTRDCISKKYTNPIAWGVIGIYSDVLKPFIDLGTASNDTFSNYLQKIETKEYNIKHLLPCFADGRGREFIRIEEDIETLNDETPEGYHLIAVLPWKLFEIHYVFVQRRVNFIHEVYGLIQEVHNTVKDAMQTTHPEKYVSQLKRYVPSLDELMS